MNTIRVELKPLSEGRTAVVDGEGHVLASGSGGVVCQAARKLIEQGSDPLSRLEAFRGDMLCLAGLLRTFATLTVEEGDRGLKLKKWRPRDFGKGAA